MYVPFLIIAFIGGYAFSKSRKLSMVQKRNANLPAQTTIGSGSRPKSMPPFVPVGETQPQAPAAQQANSEPFIAPITIGVASGLGVALVEGLFA